MLNAGLPLDRSLSILGSLFEGGELSKVMQLLGRSGARRQIPRHVDGRASAMFSRIYVNMIRAGEAGGILESVLRYLTEYLESTTALKEEIKSALIYPIILATAAGALVDRLVSLRHSKVRRDVS